jgi:hypothetical protein
VTAQMCGLMYPPLQVVSRVLSHGVWLSDGRGSGERGAVGSPPQANAAAAAAMKRATRMAGRHMGRSGLVERHTY